MKAKSKQMKKHFNTIDRPLYARAANPRHRGVPVAMLDRSRNHHQSISSRSCDRWVAISSSPTVSRN